MSRTAVTSRAAVTSRGSSAPALMISPNYEYDQYGVVASANMVDISVPCTFQARFQLLSAQNGSGGTTLSFMSHSDVNSGNGAFLFWVSGFTVIRFNGRDENGTSGGFAKTINSTDLFNVFTWSVVIDESNVTFYRNSTDLGSTAHSYSGSLVRAARDIDFGRFNYSPIYGSTKYFEARIWNKALSPAEVAATVNRGSVEPTATDLVHLWRFDTPGNTIEDLVNSGDIVLQNPLSNNRNWSGRKPITSRAAIT